MGISTEPSSERTTYDADSAAATRGVAAFRGLPSERRERGVATSPSLLSLSLSASEQSTVEPAAEYSAEAGGKTAFRNEFSRGERVRGREAGRETEGGAAAGIDSLLADVDVVVES